MSGQSNNVGCPPAQADMLRWSAGLGAVSAEALATHEWCGVASARSRLAAAQRRGLMSAWRLLHGQPGLYTVTRAGMRAARIEGLEPSRVSPGGARHAAACCAVAAQLERAFPDHRLLGEPALRREERRRGRPFASVSLSALEAGGRARHRPDLAILARPSAIAGPVVVEVELTVKSPQRLLAICRAWARSREIAGVLYLVAPEVQGPLLRAIDSAHAAERIVPVVLEALEEIEPGTGPPERTIPGAA